MSAEGFIPLSNQLGIVGSSYGIQLGKINEKWAVRLVKGNEVLDSKVFEETGDPPNANAIVGWILQVLAIPNISPYQIAKSVGFIRQEAGRRAEELKKKPAVSVQEAKQAKLEQLPEEAQAKVKASQKTVGWVKEDEKPAPATQESPKAPTPNAAEPVGEQPKAGESGEAPKKKRVLAAIPTGSSPSEPSIVQSVPAISHVEPKSELKDTSTYVVKVPKGTKKIIIEFE
jgi:hypothetical protein